MTAHRWAWAEIDLAAIRANVEAFRALVSKVALKSAAAEKRVPKTPSIMAVIKANAYGHGAVMVARAALAAGATWLGVATVDEALELREAGITAPLLLLSEPPETALPELVAAKVTCTAASMEFLHTLSGYALLNNEEISYHLKIDTGMNRIGIRADDAVSVLREATELPRLKLGGIFTHFASADSMRDWDAQQQFERFQGVLRRAKDIGIRPPLVHACNSAATMLMPEAHFDMVRVGISIYGLHPSDDTRKLLDLTPAMSVRARATLVKPLAMGEGVGYSFTWRAYKPVHLATLPLGYADGIPRLASNKMDALIARNGKRI
jgi:alanine racemase